MSGQMKALYVLVVVCVTATVFVSGMLLGVELMPTPKPPSVPTIVIVPDAPATAGAV